MSSNSARVTTAATARRRGSRITPARLQQRRECDRVGGKVRCPSPDCRPTHRTQWRADPTTAILRGRPTQAPDHRISRGPIYRGPRPQIRRRRQHRSSYLATKRNQAPMIKPPATPRSHEAETLNSAGALRFSCCPGAQCAQLPLYVYGRGSVCLRVRRTIHRSSQAQRQVVVLPNKAIHRATGLPDTSRSVEGTFPFGSSTYFVRRT